MKPIELTLPLAYQLAEHLLPVHREDALRFYPSVWAWARSRVELPGAAWVVMADGPIVAGGVVRLGDTGILWLGARSGWERHAKHAIKVCRGIISSGVYRRYIAQVREGMVAAERFAQRIGLSRIDARNGYVFYGVAP